MSGDKIRAGLLACGRAGMQTPAMFALNAHVFGTHVSEGIGLNAAVLGLTGRLDPPEDPRDFSAPLACNLLGVPPCDAGTQAMPIPRLDYSKPPPGYTADGQTLPLRCLVVPSKA